jgi:hypothetical protein
MRAMSRTVRRGLAAAALAVSFVAGGLARAQPRPVRINYVFQPDCYRPNLGAPCDRRKTGTRLDLGPQIAVWLESADRKQFIDTLMVTNAVGFRGIGNRPGHWSLPSSPKFPYGKRLMALPVWAWARGRTYETVVMQDGGPDREFWLGFHESISSPDPFFCRPMSFSEIDVDAISCPTVVFNSAKGRLSKSDPKIYYPPRNDLRVFTERDCDDRGTSVATCPLSARSYQDLNDLDSVSAATPPYGRVFQGSWLVPDQIPDGDYALMLEIAKEWDTNPYHAHVSYTDPSLMESGLKNNLGQPSVLFRAQFRLSRFTSAQVSVTQIAGYGDWDGMTGTLHPPDQSISDQPGSGRGRLLEITQPSVTGGNPVVGRLHVTTDVPEVPPGVDAGMEPPLPDAGVSDEDAAPAPDAGPGAAPPGPDAGGACPVRRVQVTALLVPPDSVEAEHATVFFTEPTGRDFDLTDRYQVRVWEGDDASTDAFESGTPAETLLRGTPGEARMFALTDLKAMRQYTVGVRVTGRCLSNTISYNTFTTPKRKFTQLSGCFIATAAFGTSQAAAIEVLRTARDRGRSASGFAAAAVGLYERASPPLADLLRGTEVGRALIRDALAPVVAGVGAVFGRGR